MKTAVFVYQAAQVQEIPALLATIKGNYDVIACGADIEFLLEEKKIPYRSARSMFTLHPYERLRRARELSEKIMDAEELLFFSYKGISIARLFTPSLFYYLTSFLYYFDIATSALQEPYDEVVLFGSPEDRRPTAAVLEKFNARVFEDGVRLVCQKHGITLTIVPPKIEARGMHERIFTIKRALFGCVMYAFNFFVRVVVHKKKIRILASEFWKNVSPLMHELPESELLLMDRSEAFTIGFWEIMRHRMQFIHSEDFVTREIIRIAHAESLRFKEEWTLTKSAHSHLRSASFKEYSLAPILEMVLGHFLFASEKIVRDIEGTDAMLKHLRPDVVMVRASTSAQTHFAILCELARLHNIPSLEVQHGVFSVGPETETSNRTAEYIANYGPIEQKVWREHEYAPRSQFIGVGSPRFDPYVAKNVTREPLSDGTFKILHIAPPWFPGSWNDSWDVLEYFRTMASAVRSIPNVLVTIKLRAGRAGESFYHETIRRTFSDIPHTIKQYESLSDLLPWADAVVSCHSTALLEALMANRPVILDASLPVYAQLITNDFKLHRTAGAFVVVETPDALKEELSVLYLNAGARKALAKRAEAFMRENYMFEDGKSSKRLAEVVRTLACLKETR